LSRGDLTHLPWRARPAEVCLDERNHMMPSFQGDEYWRGVSTTNEIIGFKAVRLLGIATGGSYSSPEEALENMCAHAMQGGANAVIGMRFAYRVTQDNSPAIFAYGTRVWVEPIEF
jgi:uncharacterized protein YbjQ (UPF0145 family)